MHPLTVPNSPTFYPMFLDQCFIILTYIHGPNRNLCFENVQSLETSMLLAKTLNYYYVMGQLTRINDSLDHY